MVGTLVLLGSGEFEPWTRVADRWMLDRATGDGTVLILPTASAPEGEATFARWGRMGLEHYGDQGIPARLLEVRTREDAEEDRMAEAVGRASAVYFSGGNPAYLASALVGTRLWSAILAGLDRGLAYAGCSAGIASLGERAFDSGAARNGLVGDAWRPGLSLLPRTILAPHWDMAEAFMPGLQGWFKASVPQGWRLLAVDERTAVMGDGEDWIVLGSGGALIVEGDREAAFPSGSSFTETLTDSDPAPA